MISAEWCSFVIHQVNFITVCAVPYYKNVTIESFLHWILFLYTLAHSLAKGSDIHSHTRDTIAFILYRIVWEMLVKYGKLLFVEEV